MIQTRAAPAAEVAVSETMTSVAHSVAHALSTVDVDEVRRRYWEQNEFVYLERWLPAALVEPMLAEVERVRPAINRNYIPRHKKGGSIRFHFDTSYYRGARYTVLLGLIERSSSRLVCQLYKNDPRRAPVELQLATHPGTLILFNGDTLWHAVTPLGQNEERVSLTLEY